MNEEANNVIQFPAQASYEPQMMGDDMLTRFDENKKQYIDYMIDYYASQLYDKLAMHGFGVEEDEFRKSFIYTIECLRGTLYRDVDLEHPFIKILEELNDMEFDHEID